jgi:hypothetical protein
LWNSKVIALWCLCGGLVAFIVFIVSPYFYLLQSQMPRWRHFRVVDNCFRVIRFEATKLCCEMRLSKDPIRQLDFRMKKQGKNEKQKTATQ